MITELFNIYPPVIHNPSTATYEYKSFPPFISFMLNTDGCTHALSL